MTTNDYFLVASSIMNVLLFAMLVKARNDKDMVERKSEMDYFKQSTYSQMDQIQDRMDRMEKCCKAPNREV
jgi:predicted lipoprotein